MDLGAQTGKLLAAGAASPKGRGIWGPILFKIKVQTPPFSVGISTSAMGEEGKNLPENAAGAGNLPIFSKHNFLGAPSAYFCRVKSERDNKHPSSEV